jgi:hypothetical protein
LAYTASAGADLQLGLPYQQPLPPPLLLLPPPPLGRPPPDLLSLPQPPNPPPALSKSACVHVAYSIATSVWVLLPLSTVLGFRSASNVSQSFALNALGASSERMYTSNTIAELSGPRFGHRGSICHDIQDGLEYGLVVLHPSFSDVPTVYLVVNDSLASCHPLQSFLPLQRIQQIGSRRENASKVCYRILTILNLVGDVYHIACCRLTLQALPFVDQ